MRTDALSGWTLLDAVYRASPNCIMVVDPDGRIQDVNEAGQRLLASQSDGVLNGSSFVDLIDPADRVPWLENHRLVCGGDVRSWQFNLAVRDRHPRRMETRAAPVALENGLTGHLAVVQDITAQHDSEIDAAHFAAIVASSNDGIVSKDLNGIVTSWNAAAARIFGYEPDEMIGQSITRLIPPELIDQEAVILSRLRRGERIEHFDTVRVTKDGREIHVSLTISPVRDRSGHLIGASKIVRDITDRKQAEDLQKLLMEELNHRVKNTLATVQAIASRTVRTARSPSEFVESFSGRLQSLSKTHTILTSNAWRGAELSALIRDQIVARDDAERVSLAGSSVMLDPQAVLHLSLILHELGTNSHKYGSLSVPTGRLHIMWALKTNPGPRLAIAWVESHGPPVAAPTRHGFGTALIERTIKGQSGQIDVDYAESGLVCRFELPIETGKGIRTGCDERDSVMADARASLGLQGKRLLLVEDEPLIALGMVDLLSEAGIEVLGPVATVKEALTSLVQPIDIALLDANLGGQSVEAVAAALTEAGIPFVFVTGYARQGLPDGFRHIPIVSKPVDAAALKDTIARVLTHGVEAGSLARV